MTTGQRSQGGLPEEVKSEQGQAPRPPTPNLGRGRKTNLCFRALMFFALVAKKKKNLALKNPLLFISAWINKSFRSKASLLQY